MRAVNLRRYIIWIVFLSFLPGLSFAQSTLWKISREDAGPSYLFGTLHVPQNRFIEFTDSVYMAITETDFFYGEIDLVLGITREMMSDAFRSFIAEKNQYLDSVKSTPSWRNMVSAINKADQLELSPDSLQQVLTYSSQRTQMQFDRDKNVLPADLMLEYFAAGLGKKVGGLESYLSQLQMGYDMLNLTLEDPQISDIETEKKMARKVEELYLKNNIDSIFTMYNSLQPAMREIMFDNRNKTMADSMQLHMEEGNCFFAVGVGHLPGPNGLIELLRQQGFQVTPVISDRKISIKVINALNKEAVKESKKKNIKGN